MRRIAIAALLVVMSAPAARADRLTDLVAYALRDATVAYAVCETYGHKNAADVYVAMASLLDLYRKVGGTDAELAGFLKDLAPMVLPRPKPKLSEALRRRTRALIDKRLVPASCGDAAAKEHYAHGSRYLIEIYGSMRAETDREKTKAK